ncbi:unnamed protein product, partial [Cuscuta epithymum]
MENSDSKDASQSVRVAVNIRPLLTAELLLGCTDCMTVLPAEKQVLIGSHTFTFDHVFGGAGCPSSRIFDDCVLTLVESLFQGYNGTVLAYGQTGSGKTYTMGTNYNGSDHSEGVIPRVMETIFSRVNELKDSMECLIRVSFIEIFKEEVFDLLDQNTPAPCKGEGASQARVAVHARAPIHIRETAVGGIALAGVTEAEVKTKEEMASYLLRGAVSRATASTNMNSQSSRSHAIFTIHMVQKRICNNSSQGAPDDASGDDILCAKLHLVDLAGSERAKRTGADGIRLQEGIHINKGLLALGNVISALGDDKKRKECAHIPYRDSKLTRLLQDSLGGNSRTVMIACVSPADTNTEETINTLKYANRARNIQNKAIVNRDPAAAQMQKMKSEIQQLQAELLCLRGDSNVPSEELQILKHKISLLESSYAALQQELLECQVERDMFMMKLEQAGLGNQLGNADPNFEQNFDMMKKYASKIQELEGDLQRMRRLNHSRHTVSDDYLGLDDESHSKGSASAESESDMGIKELNGGAEVEEKELEHSSLQEQLDRELKELDKRLEQKEAEMKRYTDVVDTSVLKQHYEKKVHELEQEKKSMQKEIEKLKHILSNLSSNSDDSAQKLKEEYIQKLNFLESQVAELKKKQDAQSQILRQKQKSDDAAKRLQSEIQRIKAQKVQLQQTIKQESEQFRSWKASREKEVLQLKKEGRRNEYEMLKLQAFNRRQKMVLQRKTEEAANATRRLKELLESRKRTHVSGISNNSVPGSQAVMQAIEHELEVTVRVHEVRSEYERQSEERTKMIKELEELKQTNISDSSPLTMSPGAISSRIRALENMVATSSSALISMGAHLSDAEESAQRERAYSVRERLNHVKSLPESKVIMNFLYDLLSSSRCQMRDREFDCIEKNSEIRDLKKKVVSLVEQLESQKTERIRLEKLLKAFSKNQASSEPCRLSEIGKGGHIYDLRPKGSRGSFISHGGGLLEEDDMDTSDTDNEKSEEGGHKLQHGGGGGEGSDGGNALPCCSCSRKSSCTARRWCECRAAGRHCLVSCGASWCSNHEKLQLPSSNQAVGGVEESESEQKDSTTLASHGAMLLQTAFSDKSAEPKHEDPAAESIRRKPLSDIGNTLVKPNVPKP